MPLTPSDAAALRQAIAALATDVHDIWTLPEHIQRFSTGPVERYRATVAIAKVLGWHSFEEDGNPHDFLFDQHQVIGQTHLSLLFVLRAHLAGEDPALASPESWHDTLVAREGDGVARSTARVALMEQAVLAWNDITPAALNPSRCVALTVAQPLVPVP